MGKNNKKVLDVALIGMDERSSTLMRMFFKRTCEGFALVVDDSHAVVDIIDTHFSNYEQLLSQSLAKMPHRAVIVLASSTIPLIEHDNLIYLYKPVKANEMMVAIDWAKDISLGKKPVKPFFSDPKAIATPKKQPEPIKPAPPIVLNIADIPVAKPPVAPVTANKLANNYAEEKNAKHINIEEQKKKAKYLSAITIEEKEFDDIVGRVTGLNINHIKDKHLAAYDARRHYQGYVQAAYLVCRQKSQTLQLNCHLLRPLVILPHSNEVWLDADERALKEISGVWLSPSNVAVVPVDKSILCKIDDLTKIQEMQAFLWKLAIWTSKGRYPKAIDVDGPVYLKQWPDLSRYVVTPHALRISGFLITRGPDSMINIAQLLNIELRYVYVFISAAYALGLASQATRQADILVNPTLPSAPVVKKNLFNKIIDKLRGK